MSRQPLFVTRKFPPSVGGMETLSSSVWRSLQVMRPDVRKISHGGTNLALIWWIPWCALRLIWLCARGRVECVLCGDALISAVCAPILQIFRIDQSTMVMGLDITFDSRLYRAIAHPPLRRVRRVIAISSATAQAARAAGVPEAHLSVLRLGVAVPVQSLAQETARARMTARLGLQPTDRLVLGLGRLVKRKGARWFTAHVLPLLGTNVHYVIAGDGPDRELVQRAADEAGVANRVHLIGRVSDDVREELMAGADLFVQPNVPVPGDIEGFGLVAVETALRQTVVVASALEGINDAVISGQTGILLPPLDEQAWVDTLSSLLADSAALRQLGKEYAEAARRIFSEQAMGESLGALLGPPWQTSGQPGSG